jgi:hypothetical protein
MKTDIIVVYACPSPKCENYYGSSSMGKLEEIPNTDLKNEITFYRNRCPNCGIPREHRYAKLISQDEAAEALRRVRQEADIGP